MRIYYFVFGLFLLLQIVDASEIQLTLNTDSHYARINKLVVSPNKKLLASVSNDKIVKIYDTATMKLKKELYGEIDYEKNGIINTALFTEDSKYLIVAGYFFHNDFNYLRVYNLETEKIEFIIKTSKFPITDICLSADSKYLLTSSNSGIVDIIDFQKKEKINSVKLQQRYISSIKFLKNNDKHTFVSTSNDNTVSIYSIDKEKILYKTTVPNSTTPNAVAVNDNDIAVVSDMYLFIYDYNLNLIDEIPFEPFLAVNNVSFSDDGSLLLTGGSPENKKVTSLLKNGSEKYLTKNMLKVYDAKNYYQTLLSFDQSNESYVNSSVFLNNNEIISGTTDYSLYFNNIKTEKSMRKTTPIIIPDRINISNNNIYLTFDTLNKTFKYDYQNLKLSSLEKIKFNENKQINGTLELSKEAFNGSYIVKADEFTLYVVDKLNKLYKLAINENYVITDYLWFKNFIVIANANGDINIYSIQNNDVKKIYVLKGKSFIFKALAKGDKYLYSLGAEGIVNIWDLNTLIERNETKPIASLFIDLNYEYVLWTEEGYFTVSSSKALNYINWHINQGYSKEAKRYHIGKFYDVFFRPDLVKLKLQGKDITPYTKGLTAKDALKNPPPEVKITTVDTQEILHKNDLTYTAQVNTKNDTAKVKFNVSDFGGGIGTIRIYQEGKLIKTIGNSKINKVIANIDTKLEEKKKEEQYKEAQHLALAKAVDGKNLKFDEQLLSVNQNNTISNNSGHYEIDIALKKGINQISIEAFNKTNTITSFRSTVNINANIPSKKPKLYAIVAGVNNFESSYGNSLKNLKYAVNDAKAIQEIVSKQKNKLFENVEVIHLEDNKVTKENIEKAFKEVKQKASLEDTVVFYISTHGISANGKFYLIPSNNAQISNLIEFGEIFKNSSELKSLNQIFMIDACQSGSANDIASAVYDSRASVLARSSGIHLLSASTSGTNAFENDELKHSNFTYQIMKAVNNTNTDENKDGFISIIEVSDILKKQNENDKQFPVIQNIGNDVNINKIAN